MTINGGNRGSDPDVEDVTEERPAPDSDERGRTAHHGDQAGPASADAGKPQSPQTGDPELPDRKPG
jgi:hypothetical protein